MNVVISSSTDAASTSSSSTASASTTTPFDVVGGGGRGGGGIKGGGDGVGEDHLARLANLAQGVGKEDSDSTATSTPTAADAAALYPGYVPGWPNYYQQFGQPSLAPAAFSAWPTQWNGAAAMSAWPAYAQSKKGRQTYQRYQTSVLEQKFLQSSYVSKKQREELRMQTNLTDRQIKIWFQNRRMKAKKEKHRLEEGGEHSTLLPPTKGSLPLPHGSLPALPPGLQQHLQQQQQQQQDGGCSSLGLDDKDKVGQSGWHMAHNPALLAHAAHQFWPGAPSHPYAIPQYQLCPPNI